MAQRRQGHYTIPEELARLADQSRVAVRRAGLPRPDGKCVVYWMQRAQRGIDNPALDLAIELGNELELPVIAFFSAISSGMLALTGIGMAIFYPASSALLPRVVPERLLQEASAVSRLAMNGGQMGGAVLAGRCVRALAAGPPPA